MLSLFFLVLFFVFLCGAAAAPTIFGGTEVDRRGAPWQVYIEISSDLGASWDCGGTIIDRRVVLTAAHCIGQVMTVVIVDKSQEERVSRGGAGAIYEEIARGIGHTMCSFSFGLIY
jgi:secreted trypsin-like serine protease